MAQFIGHAGNLLKEKAIDRRLNLLVSLFLGTCIFCFLIGITVARGSLLWVFVGALGLILATRLFTRHFDKQIRMARNEEDGAAGEREIIPFFKQLPDAFTVVCDLDFADTYPAATGRARFA